MRRLPRVLPAVLALALVIPMLGCAAGEPEADEVPTVIGAWEYSTTSAAVRAEILKAEYRWEMRDQQGAHDHAKAAIALDPLYGYAYLLAAVTAPGFEDLRANLRRAIENSAGASPAERLLIESAQKSFDGDAEGELEAIRALVALDESNPRGHYVLGWMLYSRNRDLEARDAFRRAIELAPDFAAAHASLGYNYVIEQPVDFAAAEPHVQRALELVPEEPYAHDMLGDLRRAEGRLAEAREAYTRQAELDTTKALPYSQRGHVYTFMGDYAAARSDFARARDKGVGNEPAVWARYLAYTHVYQGQPEVALDSIQSSLAQFEGWNLSSIEGQRIAALQDIVVLALELDRLDLARTALAERSQIMRARAEQTGTAEFRAGTESTIAFWEGYLAARAGEHRTALAKADEAIRLVASQRDPRRNEYAHAVMGVVAQREGRHAEAVAHFEQSDHDNPWVEYELALALEGAGRTDEAMALFRRIADFRFNNLVVALVKPLAQARVAQVAQAN